MAIIRLEDTNGTLIENVEIDDAISSLSRVFYNLS